MRTYHVRFSDLKEGRTASEDCVTVYLALDVEAEEEPMDVPTMTVPQGDLLRRMAVLERFVGKITDIVKPTESK